MIVYVQLLRALQSFSKKIFEKSQQLEEELETLSEKTHSSQQNLANTFNKFLMLSSGQFIETRVVRPKSDKNKKEKIKVPTVLNDQKKVKAGDLVDRYKQSLILGMKAMEYTIPQSILINTLKKQQDMKTPNLPICKNDTFNSKPLPYIIGTPEFLQYGDLGLRGAFDDTVFYNMDEKEIKEKNEEKVEEEKEEEEDDDDDDDDEEEDDEDENEEEKKKIEVKKKEMNETVESSDEYFDFAWLSEFRSSLLPKLQKYSEPQNQPLNRAAIRTFFPNASNEQVDDVFEYFEDANTNVGNKQEIVITVAQLIQLFKEQTLPLQSSSNMSTVKSNAVAHKDDEEDDDDDEDEEDDSDDNKKQIETNNKQKINDNNTNTKTETGSDDDDNFFNQKKTRLTDFGLGDDNDDLTTIGKDLNAVSTKETSDDKEQQNEKENINNDENNENDENTDKIVMDSSELKPDKTPSITNKKNVLANILNDNSSDEDIFSSMNANKKKENRGNDIFDKESDNENDNENKNENHIQSIQPNNDASLATTNNMTSITKKKGFVFDDSDEDEIVNVDKDQTINTMHPHFIAAENDENQNDKQVKEETATVTTVDSHALLLRDIEVDENNNNESQLQIQEENDTFEDSLFSKKEKKNKLLWLDNDETDEALTNTLPKQDVNTNATANTAPTKKTKSIWDNDDSDDNKQDLFGLSSTKDTISTQSLKPKLNNATLWDEEEEEEEKDIFDKNDSSNVEMKEEVQDQTLIKEENVDIINESHLENQEDIQQPLLPKNDDEKDIFDNNSNQFSTVENEEITKTQQQSLLRKEEEFVEEKEVEASQTDKKDNEENVTKFSADDVGLLGDDDDATKTKNISYNDQQNPSNIGNVNIEVIHERSNDDNNNDNNDDNKVEIKTNEKKTENQEEATNKNKSNALALFDDFLQEHTTKKKTKVKSDLFDFNEPKTSIGSKFANLNINVAALRPGSQLPKKVSQQPNELDSTIALKKPTLHQARRKKTKKMVDVDDKNNSANEQINVTSHRDDLDIENYESHDVHSIHNVIINSTANNEEDNQKQHEFNSDQSIVNDPLLKTSNQITEKSFAITDDMLNNLCDFDNDNDNDNTHNNNENDDDTAHTFNEINENKPKITNAKQKQDTDNDSLFEL